MAHESMTGETSEPRDLSRRQFLGLGIGGAAAVGLAGYGMWRIRENLVESSPERIANLMSRRLSSGEVYHGAEIAYDYMLIFPDDGDINHPGGIDSPFILGNGKYGFASYDQTTGEAKVIIAPDGGTLMERPYGPRMEEVGAPRPQPGIIKADIARGYYESQEAYGESGRYYITVIGIQPGPIAQGANIHRAGDPMFSGK